MQGRKKDFHQLCSSLEHLAGTMVQVLAHPTVSYGLLLLLLSAPAQMPWVVQARMLLPTEQAASSNKS
jgi:hypothetical protein